MVKILWDEEVCDTCGRVKKMEDISKIRGEIRIQEGATYFKGKAICKECEDGN